MVEIELPAIPANAWFGITIERGMIAATAAYAVTLNDGLGRSPRRRWFPDHTLALLYAAGRAEALGLPLFDRTGQ